MPEEPLSDSDEEVKMPAAAPIVLTEANEQQTIVVGKLRCEEYPKILIVDDQVYHAEAIKIQLDSLGVNS